MLPIPNQKPPKGLATFTPPLHQGQLRSVVGNSPIMGGDPTIGGNPTTGWYSTQHLVGILTIFTIDAI